MFERRKQDALDEARGSIWPVHNPAVKTVADAESAYPFVVGRVLVKDKASIFTKAGGVRRESDPALLILLVAQKYAKRHRVALGVQRVIALACCAGSWMPDPHTVQDFFSTREMQIDVRLLKGGHKQS